MTLPLRPICSQTAVVRGAALRGLEGHKPIFRRLRRHYGYSVAAPFRVGVDPPEKQFMDKWTNSSYCADLMRWSLCKVRPPCARLPSPLYFLPHIIYRILGILTYSISPYPLAGTPSIYGAQFTAA